MIKNIIFDWLGTLSDDFVSVYEAVTIVFENDQDCVGGIWRVDGDLI